MTNQLFNNFTNKLIIVLLAAFASGIFLCADASAQRTRFEDFFASPGTSTIPAPPANLPAFPAATQTGSIITSPATLQQPNFAPQATGSGQPFLGPPIGSGVTPNVDPFAIQNQPFPIFPQATQPLGPPPQILGPPLTNGAVTNPALGQPQFGNSNIYQPQYQGTGTNWQPAFDWPQDTWSSFKNEFLPRLVEHPRARQTYLYGSSGGNEMNINDIEIATTLNRANFLGGPQPLRFSPGFVFNYWGGPNSIDNPGFDMPARAYSAYLAMDHITNPQRVSGLESNLTVGYYSDFQNNSSYAIRLTGKLVGWYRINPYIVGKFGAEYFDRVNVKLLPAFGLYMTPNSDIKFDLYFPKTKLSHRIPNINDYEAWAYFGAEYGGGSWAIQRADGANDQADINDVRTYLGLEWMGPKRVTGFFEVGYVFNRNIVYRSNALDVLDLQDTMMIRSGFAF